jgi:hypothetical protein
MVPFPPTVLTEVGARTLDPVAAPRLSDQTELRPTAYVGSSLLVAGLPGGSAAAVIEALRDEVVDPDSGRPLAQVTVSERDIERERIIRGLKIKAVTEMADRVWVTRVTLEPTTEAGPQVDAFEVLQRLRSRRTAASPRAALNHVVGAGTVIGTAVRGTAISGVGVGGVGYWGGHGGGVGYWGGHGGGVGYWGGHGGPGEYASPGFGGRMPVAWTGIDPCENAPQLERPPVVVIPDTGLGSHPWFDKGLGIEVGGDWHGLELAAPGLDNPDSSLAVEPLTGALEPLAGHGTFIAGLIRQSCPQARIHAVPVMRGTGAVVEGDLHEVLSLMLLRHVEGQEKKRPELVIDVLSLSLGYYHESPADEVTDQQFRTLMEAFIERGVVVVAAAGNDSTTEPLYPAGFAGELPRQGKPALPIASVGALNAAPGSIALFSNSGAWVKAYRQGAAVVSTMPTNFQGPGGSTTAIPAADAKGPGRGTMDPDDFSSGFGVWSGTSFAAPILAAEVVSALAKQGKALKDTKNSAMTKRAKTTLEKVLSWTQP